MNEVTGNIEALSTNYIGTGSNLVEIDLEDYKPSRIEVLIQNGRLKRAVYKYSRKMGWR